MQLQEELKMSKSDLTQIGSQMDEVCIPSPPAAVCLSVAHTGPAKLTKHTVLAPVHAVQQSWEACMGLGGLWDNSVPGSHAYWALQTNTNRRTTRLQGRLYSDRPCLV